MKKLTNIVIYLVLLFVFFVAGVFLAPKLTKTAFQKVITTTSGSPTQCAVNSSEWELPASSENGYPIVDDKTEKLYIYQINAKKLQETKFLSQYQSGSMGTGTTDPYVSPDGKYTVFFQKDKKGIYLLSNETLDILAIPNTQAATYITGWMKDNARFIYYVGAETIRSKKEGMVPYENSESFDKNIGEGFFLFNIKTGENLRLGPLSNIEAIMDGSRVLTKYGSGSDFYDNRLIIFDVDTFIADYAKVKDEFMFGAGQFTLSADGAKWAFSYSEDVKAVDIIFDNFPIKKGKVVESGSWAQIQRPYVSPDGKKIVYQKTIGQIEPGRPLEATILYDSSTEKNEQIHEGWPQGWIGNEYVVSRQLITPINRDRPNASEYYLINVTTKEAIKIY
jgi:hypothetical protein